MENIQVGISGIGSYVPDKVLTNYDLSQMVDTSDEWITTRTGIKERRISSKEEATSDLATKAALRALEDAKVNPEELDLIIVASVTPDHLFPSTASILQNNIKASKAAAFDLSAGCSGFVYGMTTGANFISAGIYKKVLVIGADTLTKIVNWEDRNTCVLFGDGAGAVVLEACEEDYGLLSYDLGSDGSGADLLILSGGGSRNPATHETVDNNDHYIYMDGKEVFKFAVRTMEKASHNVVDKAGLKMEDVNLLIPHQANMRIVDAALKKLAMDKSKAYVNLDRYGNMSAASIPVAFAEAVESGSVKKGDHIILVAFGAGLTWGSLLFRWNKEELNV